MSLTIVYGTAGTGKSEFCIQSMLDLHKRGIPSVMLVPEQFAHTAEARLAEKNGYLSDDILSVSFKRLAQKHLRKAGLLGHSITKTGKSMLLSRAVLQAGDALNLYRGAASHPGFIDAMLNFISECKRSEVTPQQLAEAAEAETHAAFAAKLCELAQIYAHYSDLLGRGYTDSEDYLPLFAADVQKNNTFRGTCIFIDEFFRFTPAEYDCIRAFLACGAEVYVTLGAPTESARGIFEPVTRTAAYVTHLAKDVGQPVLPPVYLKKKHRFAASSELLHFETEYNHYPPQLYKEETHDISLYTAPDLYTEVQVLAAKICRAVKEGQLHYRDVAIIAGNAENYIDLIKTVFPLYRIPIFIDQKKPLAQHPIMVMLFSVLALMADGLETETLLAYAKTGYAGLKQDEVDTLENFALAGRLRRSDWLDEKRFLQRADSVFYETEDYTAVDADAAEALLELRSRLLTPLEHLRAQLGQSKHLRDRAAALFGFFEEIELYQTVEAEVTHLKEENELQAAQEHGEIYNLLLGLLDELVTAFGDDVIGLSRLQTIITAGLAQCEISTIPPGSDQVIFGDLGRSLVKNVKLLFVIGTNDTAFPPQLPTEGLIKDEERRRLAENGLDLGPDGQEIAFQNQFLQYNALHISKQSLHFSYPVTDTEGRGLRPADLVRQIKKMFPALSAGDNLTKPPEADDIIAGEPSAWQYVLEHFNDKTNASVPYLKEYFGKHPLYKEPYAAMLRYSRYSTSVRDLTPVMAKGLYGRELYGSVTQLERHSNCPFSYFLQYGLRAKERKILKIDAPDIGILLHKLVELASRRLEEEHKSFAELTEADAVQLADETVTDFFSALFIANLYTEKRLAALIRRLKALLAKMLQVIAAHVLRGAFEPCAFEVAFGENGELPPVTISLPTGERITLTGRIDRIDTLRQNASLYVKIIDYKTGNKTFSLSDVYNRLSLQLAVYVIAVTEGGKPLLGDTPVPAAMFYFRLADQTVDASLADAENAMLKPFKMSGLLLKDADLVRAMDTGIQGFSAIIPARMKKDGTLSDGNGTGYATMEQFQKLSGYVKRVAGEIGREILNGHVAILPCKSGNKLPCRYCAYHAVCGFDAGINKMRIAPPLKPDAVWEILEDTEDLT